MKTETLMELINLQVEAYGKEREDIRVYEDNTNNAINKCKDTEEDVRELLVAQHSYFLSSLANLTECIDKMIFLKDKLEKKQAIALNSKSHLAVVTMLGEE